MPFIPLVARCHSYDWLLLSLDLLTDSEMFRPTARGDGGGPENSVIYISPESENQCCIEEVSESINTAIPFRPWWRLPSLGRVETYYPRIVCSGWCVDTPCGVRKHQLNSGHLFSIRRCWKEGTNWTNIIWCISDSFYYHTQTDFCKGCHPSTFHRAFNVAVLWTPHLWRN